MKSNIQTAKSVHYPMGVSVVPHGIRVVCTRRALNECGIILYQNNEKTVIPFKDEYKTGELYSLEITGINTDDLSYSFYEDNETVQDPYAVALYEGVAWGEKNKRDRYKLLYADEVLKNDKRPRLNYEDSIIYGLHVRGFTAHDSSKCKFKGTFKGITEKLDYLKSIGITTVELLPAYEFDEVYTTKDSMYSNRFKDDKTNNISNYWGYMNAHYMMPKYAYASDNNPQEEFSFLVKTLHDNNMELIMQLYFPESIDDAYILDVLRFWVSKYHVDGFHLKGNGLPLNMIINDPFLKDTKLIYYGFDTGSIYHGKSVPTYRNLGSFTDNYMNRVRSYLKGDSDTIRDAFDFIKRNSETCADINYLTNYDTFTLYDVYAYDKKHNEANGENNTDGRDYNYSWNCGVEGTTRKKQVLTLRNKMYKNAWAFLMLSQGVPFIMAGDEFLNSQNGNNNPYNQDNEISWLDWKDKVKNKEFLAYAKELIAFRKKHPHFVRKKEYTMSDNLGYRMPDLSVHSDEAWMAKLENYDYAMGLMYSGKYVHHDEDIYVAYNMYWQELKLALPAMESKKWRVVLDTSLYHNPGEEIADFVTVKERSICILSRI